MGHLAAARERNGTMKALGGGWVYPVAAKTGNYTLVATDCGTLFTNRGAGGSVTFTLPVTSASLTGFWAEFATVAAQAIVVASNPTDNLIVHADATADTLTTAGTIGQHIRVICDGTGWIVESNPSAASAATAVTAVTIAT
jgi:hypothetical protein